jgi:hypothetical protein
VDFKAGSFAEALDTIIDPTTWAAPTRETYFPVPKELAALLRSSKNWKFWI